jgi:hypothetical protein
MPSLQQIAFGGMWKEVKRLLGELGGLAAAVGNFLLEFLTSSNEISNDVHTIIVDFQELEESLKREIETLKNFKFGVKWETRVINVPIAIDQVKALIDKISNTFHGKLQELLQPVKDLEVIFKQEAAPDPLGDRPSQLAKANVKYNHVVSAIHSMSVAMTDIKDMAELFEEITNDIQNLEPIFLQQGNSRMRAPEGERPFIRVGTKPKSLHH